MAAKITLVSIGMLVLTGCVAVSTPTVDTSDESKVTFDGLYPVKHSRADEAWARPGLVSA